MDFLDLDTSLKVTKANVILYSNWLVLNNTSICALSVSQRRSFLKDNIGFVESNPGAIISFLKKSGLVKSDLTTSALSYLVAQRKISYAEFCFIHLSKESLTLGDTPTLNALSLLSKYIKNKNTIVDLNDYRTLDLSLEKKEGDIIQNIRTDYFSTLLEGTGLFNFIGSQKDGKMELSSGAKEIFDYLETIEFENCLHPLNSENRFNYFASTSGGILDYLADEHPEAWNYFFPNLNKRILTEIKNKVIDFEEKGLSDLPLQQITYGAPGTGKSHGTDGEIKKIYPTKEAEKGKVFRTTFHPDSDYSTFVGCYKPTKVNDKIFSAKELQQLFIEEKDTFPNRPEYRFAAKYNKSFAKLTTKEAESVFEGISKVSTITAETPKLMASVEEYSKLSNNNAITYDFIAQSFTKAYIAAWKECLSDSQKPIFLVIEEINRGNCAQIFGDLFQLLDREDNGFSSYPIKSDADLGNHIAEALNGYSNDEFASIINGEELLLPPNLHIWATMNTSDQSLFPIDSAFKRRWDWKYVPIDTEKENWTINVNGNSYNWSSFLSIINDKIFEKTQSEDKQLGFYFCKAKDNVISAERFVSKVLFYIYNDVYKDYGFDDEMFADSSDEKNKVLSFRKYYDRIGNINEEMVEKFLTNLGVEVSEDTTKEVEEDTKNGYSIEIEYNGQKYKEQSTLETYIKVIKEIGVDKIEPLGILCHNQKIVGKEEPGKYAWRTVDGYKVLTFKLHKQLHRIIQELAEKLEIDIKIV